MKSRTANVLYDADENEAIIVGNNRADLGSRTCQLKAISKPGALEVISARRAERGPASQAQ